ncbi:hypothetical protein LG3211_0889 [Lysobacter gummosus]|nr:hypothetical protein LG3211_0889 [Lysobacter gummosus]
MRATPHADRYEIDEHRPRVIDARFIAEHSHREERDPPKTQRKLCEPIRQSVRAVNAKSTRYVPIFN